MDFGRCDLWKGLVDEEEKTKILVNWVDSPGPSSRAEKEIEEKKEKRFKFW